MAAAREHLHHVEHDARHQGQGQPTHVRLNFWLLRGLVQRHHAQTDPHRKGVERPHVGVVALTGLQGGLVQVHHNGDAGHQEQHAHHRSALRVAERLERESDQPQNQRQVEEVVQALVVQGLLRQHVAVAEAFRVDEAHAAQPVAVHERAVALHVVLLANEVPEEIPEIHPPHLVIAEERQVLPLGGHQLLKGVVEPALGLKRRADVVLVPGLVRALGQTAQGVFVRPLLLVETAHVGRAVIEAGLQLVHEVRGQA